METNLQKAKRLLKAYANIAGFDIPEDGYIFKMLELSATLDVNYKDVEKWWNRLHFMERTSFRDKTLGVNSAIDELKYTDIELMYINTLNQKS